MKYSQKILSQTVTQLCLAKGINHIVISPGSRNAPLILGFTEDKSFKTFSIVDERCAAFFALGIAQQEKKPVALVCSSGSALLNYYPAIAEAFYSDIPLVVISADRPAHLIDVGDGQTIRQEEVYTNHILYSANCRDGAMHQEFNELEINTALNKALTDNGPVHINVPFSEPLYGFVDKLTVSPKNIPPSIELATFDTELDSFISNWNAAKRKMILVGVLTPNSIEQEYLNMLGEDESVIVLTETTSNLHHPNFFPAIDQLIAPLENNQFSDLQPDLLLTFGGMVVSKKIKAFLRTNTPKTHYHIDAKGAMDTFFVLTHHFAINFNTFFKSYLVDSKTINSNYRNNWLSIKNTRLELHKSYVNSIAYSDFKVFSLLFKHIPGNAQLQLANSTTVRYAQLFSLNESLEVFCNRGTSGIDGSTSTAIGASYASTLPTVLITGDLSFFYDSNALWNQYIPKNFRIIIVNNGGGGIFRILPGKNDTDNFSTYFETKHNLTAEPLAKLYGFEYQTANNEASLETALELFFKASELPKILEVFTPSEVNDQVLLDYFNFIK
ncbi:MAG: 2-succinyl-5-enolpyruvyl-6-hydroxy-3-cyclohexene-1-carboxylic-acid synthase [Flavobacteriaceae bacterium]|nr:2-succinyl-5-enolpyruvyl-6-hydroxy-3-cyclohexene-1-carboxylic-acid synthase [Flavobacteriaceae bacterium]